MSTMLYSVFTACFLCLATAAPVPKEPPKKGEDHAAVRSNILKLAAICDAMTPAGAAPHVKAMLEAGNVDQVAQILTCMKERNAARIIEEMDDYNGAAKVLERMRDLRARKALHVAPAPRLVK